MKPLNLLIVMSDQHNRKVTGCYGNSHVSTPNLDRLASTGTLFRNAYSPSPVCVPARAALATGRQIHLTRYWDNASPYDGRFRSWGHCLQDSGMRVESIGKLHYRNAEDATGFDQQHHPMHVVEGTGAVFGALKDPLPVRRGAAKLRNKIGVGTSSYIDYDTKITESACQWLESQRGAGSEKPWVLFVSFVAPHPPWFVPQEFFDLYEGVTLPGANPATPADDHPWLEARRISYPIDEAFTDEQRKVAIRSYYAFTSFMDANVGRVLGSLASAGLSESTRVIYFSDHGENLGNARLWGKGTLSEDSGGVPLIMAGPDVPVGHTVLAPVSLLDVYPTVLEATGAGVGTVEPGVDGVSLFELARQDQPDRKLLTQYHGSGAASGAFMLRSGIYKYLYYVGYRPQLFDLSADPEERHDLALDVKYAETLSQLERELRTHLDPEAIDTLAKADQRAIVERNGGRAAVEKRGSFGITPAPGEKLEFD